MSGKSETDATPSGPPYFSKLAPLSPNRRVDPRPSPFIAKDVTDNLDDKATEDLRFKEPTHYNLDEFEYDRNGNNPGKLIIFNHQVYDNEKIKERFGTKRDVNEIIICFQRLGFNVSEDDVVTDATIEQVRAKLDSVLKDEQTLFQSNCLVVFFLTHGDVKDKLCVKDGEIKCSDVWMKFNDCKQLEGKPKLFVFQACKGKQFASVDQPESTFNQHSPVLLDLDTSFSVNDLGPDMLLLYSTLEDYVSFRNPLTGTWFIQELCKNFSSYGRRDDVISLITRTTKCVSNSYFVMHEDDKTVLKQMPIYVSTLSRKFYLNRNKDRHLLLEMNRKQDEIHQMLEELMIYIRRK
ncbi:caspase-1-like [Anthonomus grandis grandis]|uniref:caspase-1-like n=1 Tax=Anthonomus grandis grandis TaxID=2921223 RepID=UPI002166BE59|nr:caspase-1-like [Anthonomus grandis grandis]